jgi:hypothetical protein
MPDTHIKTIVVVTDDWRGIRRHFSQLETMYTISVTDTKHAKQVYLRTKPDVIFLEKDTQLSFKTSCQLCKFSRQSARLFECGL